jgi:MFS family permease
MSSQPAATGPTPKPWEALVHRDFLFMWTSGVFLNISMVIRNLIAGQWLYDETGSAALLGFLGVVMLAQLPMILYGGALADRIDRKKLMILTQLVAVAMVSVMTALAFADALRPWHIFAITALSGMVNTLGGAARPAMLPRVVPRHLLPQAVTILTISGQASQIGAPIFFGGLYDGLGVAVALLITTIVTTASVVFPFFIKASGKPEEKPRTSTWTSLKEGFRFVSKHQLLPGLYALDFAVTVVSFYRQLFPIFAKELYGLGATGTGLLNSANSAGSILGSFLVFFTERVAHKGRLVLFAVALYAVFLIAFGLVHTLWLGLIIVAVLGLTDSVSMTMRQAIVQLTTPDQLLGRASSVRNFAAMVSNNLGQIEVGVTSAAIGAGSTMVLGGILSVFFVIIIWRFMPGIWRYQYRRGETAPAEAAPAQAGR